MATLTPPTNEMNFIIKGDLDVLAGYAGETGTGTVYIRSGGLYTEGLADLNETTINTTNGAFSVLGSNMVDVNVTAPIQLQAAGASYLQTSSSTVTVAASNATTGKVLISAAGSGADSVKLLASNVTDGQINILSNGGSSTINPIKITASDATNGNMVLTAAGNFAGSNPAILLNATNTTSGMIRLSSAGNTAGTAAVNITATGTTAGNILIEGYGDYTGNNPAVYIRANNASSGGKVLIESTHTAVDSIWVSATNGGVKITGTNDILINTTDTTNGVTIASTSLVPVNIGSAGSLTTVYGNLTVQGTTTTLNTVTLTVDDNVVILNSGTAVSGVDAGLAVRRYQTPNNTPTGDVITTPNPIQEFGGFQAGSATPGTLVLDEYASAITDFYQGWWIEVTSGTGINQVRRIKTYNGTTKTATLYVTADNVGPTPGPLFTDGLNLVTAPAAADTYILYSASYTCSFYNEADFKWSFWTISNPDINGITQSNIQQPQAIESGQVDVAPQIYNNAHVVATGTSLNIGLKGHGVAIGDRVSLSNSFSLTPSVASGMYVVVTVPDADHFTVTAAASTVSANDSSITVVNEKSSLLKVNVIEPYTPGYPLNITGITLSTTILVPKTSTADFTVTPCALYGCYIIMISDLQSVGSFAVYSLALGSAATGGGSISRIAGSVGSQNQRIQMDWVAGAKPVIRQRPAASTGVLTGNFSYFLRIYSGI